MKTDQILLGIKRVKQTASSLTFKFVFYVLALLEPNKGLNLLNILWIGLLCTL